MTRILVVDDDSLFASMLERKLLTMGYEVMVSRNLAQTRVNLDSQAFDLVLLDVHLPDGSGLDILNDIRQSHGLPEVVIITGAGDPDGAELAIRSGAWDYIQKGTSLSHLVLPVTRALQHRELKKSQDPLSQIKRETIIGNSPALRQSLNLVSQAAQSDINVLISGETGTGKELFAWCLHANSKRANGNFVVVDCAALPENLIESHLFGHTRGAFTGADKDRIGLIRQADGGTLFLDEIGELPISLQRAFLRALQEHRFRPVGAEKEIESDFRLIAATNRNLDEMAQQGLFRQDLLYRIRSLVIHLPPLRERIDDIELLANHFLDKVSLREGAVRKTMSDEFLNGLKQYAWPGNVRELLHCLERSTTTAGFERVLLPHHLPEEIRVAILRSSLNPAPRPDNQKSVLEHHRSFTTLEEFRKAAEFQYLQELLSHFRGDVRQAWKTSGLSRSRFYALLKKHNLSISQD